MDAQTIWQCNLSSIQVSVNGGQTWQSTGQGGNYCIMSFVDAKTGWLLKSGTIELTTDGGQSWNEVTLPEGGKDIGAISLRTASEGYVLTPDGVLHKTQDGGNSWSSVTLDLTKYGQMQFLPATDPGYPPSVAIRFFDADHGVIVMSLVGSGSSKIVAFRTADSGQTWTEEAVPATIGTLYLTHDGQYLTVSSILEAKKVTVLRYTGE
ncbi:WD40/YVTN/BNR-like repeat-containing protein [Chloroflexota bacterium]